MTHQQQIDDYLSALRTALGPITLDEREEIVREIQAHIRDSMEQPDADPTTVLKRMGPASELAAQYRDGLLIRRASRSFSPLLLLRATVRLATKGIFGFLVFLCAMIGYAIGGGLVVTAFAKCIIPQNTGLWMVGGRICNSGVLFPAPQPPAHEILGWWYIPVAFVLGCLVLLCTTYSIRSCLRLSRRWQSALRRPLRSFGTA